MWKEVWYVQLGQVGVAWGWRELSEIPLKRVEQKRGDGKKDFKKSGEQVGSRGGYLKNRGLGTPSRTMIMY